MFTGDTNLTNSLSSVKLLCSLYGTSYLDGKATKTYVNTDFLLLIINYKNRKGVSKIEE